jgi:hypothetical protein
LSQTLPDAIKIQIIELAFKREAPKGNSPAYLASRLKPIALITR